jgi:hypothetical protein
MRLLAFAGRGAGKCGTRAQAKAKGQAAKACPFEELRRKGLPPFSSPFQPRGSIFVELDLWRRRK